MLREVGLEVDVAEADGVGSLGGYAAVVVAGSLYMGRWHRDARDWDAVRSFADSFAARRRRTATAAAAREA